MVLIPKDKYQLRNIVVLISGKAGAGKTTVANFMKRSLPPESVGLVGSFASSIKTIAREMGWNDVKDEEGRRLLQQLGNFGREYNKDVWVELMMQNVERLTHPYGFDFLFVDDWRFPNEEGWFENREDVFSTWTVRVERMQTELLNASDPDISENALPTVSEGYYDFVIQNKYITLDELNAQSRLILQTIIDREYEGELI